MKIGIMQPYFLPYIGYFQLIKHTDRFILIDTVQFIRHGWIERNRVLKPIVDWQYIAIPLVKQSRETLIKDTIINNSEDWRSKILRQLEHYKKRAPYYEETIRVLKQALDCDTVNITRFNKHVLSIICNYLNIQRDFEVFSDMDIKIETPTAPDEWALNICKAIGGNIEYWNPIGGLDFFDPKKYEDNNVTIKFLKATIEPYSQRREGFEAGLSIIDVMMFNSPEQINEMLNKYELL